MTTDDKTTQALRKEISELQILVKELGEENRHLRDICKENGVHFDEGLAVRRHKRYFRQLCAEHPIEGTAVASDVLGAIPIVRGIATCAGSILCTGLIARSFFAAFTQLTVQFPWKFGGRIMITLEGHARGWSKVQVQLQQLHAAAAGMQFVARWSHKRHRSACVHGARIAPFGEFLCDFKRGKVVGARGFEPRTG